MKKILIVEDEAAYLNILKLQLTRKGYLVIEAIDGKMGLQKARTENPDLILLDVRMPVMDGITMLDVLRKDKLGKKTKVILLTNLEPDDKMVGKVISDQPLYYFVKSDIKLDELFAKIKTLLSY